MESVEHKIRNLNIKNEDRAIFKFNSGMGAILCVNCSYIIKKGYEYDENEKAYIRGESEFKIVGHLCEKCNQIRRVLLEKIKFKKEEDE